MKIELPYDTTVPLLDIDLKKSKKDLCTPMFFAALFTMAKKWEQSKCPSTDDWIKKVWYTHTNVRTHTQGHYSAVKECNLAICDNWVNLKDLKSDRGRQMHDFTYIWNLKCTKQKQTLLVFQCFCQGR